MLSELWFFVFGIIFAYLVVPVLCVVLSVFYAAIEATIHMLKHAEIKEGYPWYSKIMITPRYFWVKLKYYAKWRRFK